MARRNGPEKPPVSLVGSDADVAFYRRQLAQLGQPALILGCANGRLAWELCAELPSVVGVDPSPAMIAFAEGERAQRPPEIAGRVRFLSADLRSLRLADRFGSVLAPHNVLALMPSVLDLEAGVAPPPAPFFPGGPFGFRAGNSPPGGGPARGSRGNRSPLGSW